MNLFFCPLFFPSFFPLCLSGCEGEGGGMRKEEREKKWVVFKRRQRQINLWKVICDPGKRSLFLLTDSCKEKNTVAVAVQHSSGSLSFSSFSSLFLSLLPSERRVEGRGGGRGLNGGSGQGIV